MGRHAVLCSSFGSNLIHFRLSRKFHRGENCAGTIKTGKKLKETLTVLAGAFDLHSPRHHKTQNDRP